MGGQRTTIWILACILAGMDVRAAIPNPPRSSYEGIADRNVFNLRAPPPKEDADALKPKAQIPKLTLNGITTILGKKVTFITAPSAKPGAPATTVMLAEGQAQDEVEVRQIDEKAGMVKVVNHGEEQTLDFEHNGAKSSPPPANVATPLRNPPAIQVPPAGMNGIRPLRTLPSRSTTSFHGPEIQAAQ
jgi:hypothetical protein